MVQTEEEVLAWAASGAMSLTGRGDGPPLGPPAALVPKVRSVGQALGVDALGFLAERGALLGLARHGTTSCGGATRLLRAAGGWFAVCLARPDDLDLLPAWLGTDAGDDPWRAVADAARTRPVPQVVADGARLGLAVAALGETGPVAEPVGFERLAGRPAPSTPDGLLVVDLSALWAGPLCGSVLADAGARVVKVESTTRPDGARSGDVAFFDLLNAGKESVAVDLDQPSGREALRRLVHAADVVIEGSRPRALEQLGIDARRALREHRPRVWVSITGHGRDDPARGRVGFGDDAAVAGGLVARDEEGPCFCADAVADPASGLVAAAAATERLRHGGSWLVDVALARVSAWLAAPTLPVPSGTEAASPRASRLRGTASPLGADTDAVLGQIGAAATGMVDR